MADGSKVWVCKDCGTEHQPSETVVASPDPVLQADVNAAAAQMTPPVAPAAPAAPAPVAAPTIPPAVSPVDPTKP